MNREEAEDIVQDILLKLWQQRHELKGVKNLEACAVTSARNLALDRMAKAEQRNVSFEEVTHDRADECQLSAHERMEHDERLQRVNDMINALPEKQRTVLQLRDIEGKAYKEIADMMNITEADVKVNLFRARESLRKKMN